MTTMLIAAAIFTFHNNFWVNLHQTLHAEAARRASGGPCRWMPRWSRGTRTSRGGICCATGTVPFKDALRNLVRDVAR